jgi:hypothetical protein
VKGKRRAILKQHTDANLNPEYSLLILSIPNLGNHNDAR